MVRSIVLLTIMIRNNMRSKLYQLTNLNKIKNYRNVQSIKSIYSPILSHIPTSSNTMTCLRLPIISILSMNTVTEVLWKVYLPNKVNSQNKTLYLFLSSYLKLFRF